MIAHNGEREFNVEFFGEKIVPIASGQSILRASLGAGIPHFHACGGNAKCSTCRVMVLEGGEFLSEQNRAETKLKDKIGLPAAVRLACQTHVLGGFVKVERMLKDHADLPDVVLLDEKRPGKFKLKPLGQEKHLVLFFLDIRNFTTFVETHPPFDVVYAMRKIFGTFFDVLSKHDGDVLETAGDEIYAIFGMNTHLKAAADSGIAASLEILVALDELNNTYHNILQNKMEVGIGLHSGSVVLGKISVGGKPKLSTVGLAINVASRIQQHTKKLNNSILVSEDVIRQSSMKPKTEGTKLKLDGVSSPVSVYALGKPYARPQVTQELTGGGRATRSQDLST